MRKIPVAMATQHADSATRHVLIKDEPDEAREVVRTARKKRENKERWL